MGGVNREGTYGDLPQVPLSGAEEDRTPDLDSAIVALSQLSYRPNYAEYRSLGCEDFILWRPNDLVKGPLAAIPEKTLPMSPC